VATQNSRRVRSDTVPVWAETSSRRTVVGLVIGMAIIASAFAIGSDTSDLYRGNPSGRALLRPFPDVRVTCSRVADTGDAVDPALSYPVWRAVSPPAAVARRARPLVDRVSPGCSPLRGWR
jgi:hypothetical protein